MLNWYLLIRNWKRFTLLDLYSFFVPLEIISSKTNDIALNNTNTDKNTNTDQNKITNEIKNTDDVITGNNSAGTRRRRVAALNADIIRKLTDN